MFTTKFDGAPWDKSELNKSGVPLEHIKGLYRSEEYSPTDACARFERETKEHYSHDEVYGNSWTVNSYIDVPLHYAYDYVANPYSLEEWSYGIRGLIHKGNGIYKGVEHFAHDTEIFIKSEQQKEAFTVDYSLAWDQKEELWMRHFFRFIDAKKALNCPGTLMSWVSFKHPYYDKKSEKLPTWLKNVQHKPGRYWLGDYVRHLRSWQKLEADNLRYILEHRYHSGK